MGADKQEQFNQELDEMNFMGHWEVLKAEGSMDKIVPHVWGWDEIYSALQKADDVISLDEEPQGARRSLGLRNPVFERGKNWTTRTITAGIQLVHPDELAKAHRHNMEAFRFVIDGEESAYTVVEGEQFPMEKGDLIITPAGTWHDHINMGDEPVIWLDGLDASLWKGINVMEMETFKEERQTPDKSEGYHRRKYGTIRPMDIDEEELIGGTPPYRYPWADAYESLTAAAEDGESFSPHDGTVLEYVNAATGEPPVMPAISMRLQLLPEGEQLEAHKHVSNEIYHVVQGSGETVVSGETLEWEENDCFVVPHNEPHSHRGLDEETILFCLSDKPVFEKFSIYTETADVEAETGATATASEGAEGVAD